MKNLFGKKMNKAGIFDQLTSLVLGLVVFGIIAVVAFLIFSNLGNNTSVIADGNASGALNTTTSAAEDVTEWLSLVVIVLIGALLIGVVSRFAR